MKAIYIFITLISLSTYSYCQSSSDNNNPFGTNHLGWDDTGNTLLRITQDNYDRMTFRGLPVYNGLNGISGTEVARVTLGFDGDNTLAWSMFHLKKDAISGLMARNWFNVGTTYTGNSDLMYTGLLERPTATGVNAATDAVVAWGCNTSGLYGPDNLRFLFLSPMAGDNTDPAQTNQGLEVLRIAPTGNMGVGDFSANGFGLNEQPTHKLDVDGNVRIRQIALLAPDVLITGQEINAAGDYELTYKSFNGNSNQFLNGNGDWVTVTGTGSPDCDWAINPDGDVVTGIVVPGQWGCAQLENVGIGVQDPDFHKLEVDGGNSTSLLGAAYMSFSRFDVGNVLNISKSNGGGGINVRTMGGESATNTGIRVNVGVDDEDQTMYGVLSRATNNGALTTLVDAYGVYGYACDARNNFGVYGDVCNSVGVDWAGYFNGDIGGTGNFFYTSDMNLKDNIEDMNNAIDLVMSLSPKTYSFKTDEFSQMNLPEGEHCGLIAQDIQEVLPNLVKESTHPAKYNDEGEIISEEVDYLAVNYTEIIPILIQATKEQQAIIDEKDSQINDLESNLNSIQGEMEILSQMISDCCAIMEAKNNNQSTSSSIELNTQNILHQNQPNPFELKTEISYTIVDNGLVEVIIYDAKGIVIETLVNHKQIAGTYSVEWSDPSISRGVYFCALQINGEEHVKRMVKL